MSHFGKILAAAAMLVLGSFNQGNAAGWEVNNIWWNLIPNWRNSGQTVCIAQQHNLFTFSAVAFDIYPGPGGGRATATQRDMRPFDVYRIYAWRDGTKPNAYCMVKGWMTSDGKRVKIRRQDIRPSQRIPIIF